MSKLLFLFSTLTLLLSQVPNPVLAQTVVESSVTNEEKKKIEEAIQFNSDPQNFYANLNFFKQNQDSLGLGIHTILGPQFSLRDNVSFESDDESTEPSQTWSTATKAINLGLHLWAQRVAQNLDKVILKIDGSPVVIKGPQAGIIYLPVAYFDDDKNSSLLSKANRARYLSHESVHSQCSTPRKCGNLHVACDSSSPFYGKQICDSDMSGAIGFDIEFLSSIGKTFSQSLSAYEHEKLLLELSFSKSLIVGKGGDE